MKILILFVLFVTTTVYSQTITIVPTTTTTLSTTTTTVTTTTTTVITTTTTTPTTTTTTTTTTTLKTTVTISTTPHSATRNTNIDYGVCNCDLTANLCDTNCCCDKLCTDVDVIVAFNNCTSATKYATTNSNKKWCVPAVELFLQNTPYILNAFGDLLCVDVNNSISMNYYQAPLTDSLNKKEQFVNELVQTYYPTSIQSSILSIEFNQNALYFTNKDYIWVINSNDIFGFLTLPIQVGTKCLDGPPLNYLVERNSSCTFDSSAVLSQCNNLVTTSLSLKYFIENFKIVPSPVVYKKCATPKYSCSNLLGFRLRFCKFGNDQPTLCPNSPSTLLVPQVTNNKCQNLVKKITYIMPYKNPDGFTEPRIDVEFFDAYDITSTTKTFFTQYFEIKYVPSTASLENFVFENKLSGNPGYLVNQPLVAGYFDGTNVNVNQNRYSRFTVLQSNTAGQCSTDDSNRIAIKFGINMLTECKFEITLTSLSDSVCNSLQTQIDSIILGSSISNRANAFAPFATSSTSDFTQIVNANPTTMPIYNSALSQCKSVRATASIQIAYALVGNTNNPQTEIQYISYDWSETSNINLRCTSQSCTNKNQIKLSTRVTFVDVSQPPYYTQSQVKRPRPTLPGDFFYPFGASNANKLASSKLFIFFIFLVSLLNL